MVTGEKPDEQVDWSEVADSAAFEESATGKVSHISEALDALSVSVFGLPVAFLPAWMFELSGLEALHSMYGLRGRARRRLASLRKRERAWLVKLERRAQRRRIGVPHV